MWTIHSSSGNRTWRTGKFSMIITPVCLRPWWLLPGHGSMYEQLRMPCHRQHVVLQLPSPIKCSGTRLNPNPTSKCVIRLSGISSQLKKTVNAGEELYDLDKIRKSKNHESRSRLYWIAIVSTMIYNYRWWRKIYSPKTKYYSSKIMKIQSR
jgi:hypothetical protein